MRVSEFVSLLLPAAAAATVIPRTGTPKALYFLDNNPAGASVVSLQLSDSDGTLSNPVRTSTGGVGLFGLTATGPGAGGKHTDDTTLI